MSAADRSHIKSEHLKDGEEGRWLLSNGNHLPVKEITVFVSVVGREFGPEDLAAQLEREFDMQLECKGMRDYVAVSTPQYRTYRDWQLLSTTGGTNTYSNRISVLIYGPHPPLSLEILRVVELR